MKCRKQAGKLKNVEELQKSKLKEVLEKTCVKIGVGEP